MVDIGRLTDTIVSNSLLRNRIEIDAFEDAISEIVSLGNVEHIYNLSLGFNDDTEDEEVMFGLVHAIESYDITCGMEESLKVFMTAVPEILPKARNWVRIMHKRIINNADSVSIYSVLVNRTDMKAIIVGIVTSIAAEDNNRSSEKAKQFLEDIAQ